MNIKRGLKRIWVLGSVGLVIYPFFFDKFPFPIFKELMGMWGILLYFPISLMVWWGLLFLGFWISSGFSGDKKKEGE